MLKCSTADASKVSSQVKNELPGKGKEAQKEGEALFNQAGAKFDQAVRFPTDLVGSLLTTCSLPMPNPNFQKPKRKPKNSAKRPAKISTEQLTSSTRRWKTRLQRPRVDSAVGSSKVDYARDVAGVGVGQESLCICMRTTSHL